MKYQVIEDNAEEKEKEKGQSKIKKMKVNFEEPNIKISTPSINLDADNDATHQKMVSVLSNNNMGQS